MKVFFKKIFKLSEEYQENLIDENNFDRTVYKEIRPQTRNVSGLTYNDIYIIEPNGYFKVLLKSNTPYDFKEFIPNSVWLKNGLIISNIHKKDNCVYIYNSTQNHIYIRPNAMVGELLWRI